MGFADLSIAEIAEDYNVPIERVLELCSELGIAYKHPQTRLALEDVKLLIAQIENHAQKWDGEGECEGDADS
ncbi:MAG: translation initiation factor IF-2 N-terminal domain-containing protein [Actinomycetota bacterium]